MDDTKSYTLLIAPGADSDASAVRLGDGRRTVLDSVNQSLPAGQSAGSAQSPDWSDICVLLLIKCQHVSGESDNR